MRISLLLLIVFMTTSFQFIQCQNILEDAVALRQYFDTDPTQLVGKQKGLFKQQRDTVKLIVSILKKYSDTEITSKEQFSEKFGKNPFFGFASENKFIDFGGMATQSTLNVASIQPQLNRSASSGKGISVSTFVDGLAQFLVTRTKEELNVAFFQRLSNVLEKQKDLTTFFPSSSERLKFIGKDIYQYKQFLETLRNAFAEDMQLLPRNTKIWLANTNHISNPDVKLVVQDLLELSQSLLDEQKPIEIIEYLGKTAQLHKFTNTPGTTSPIQDLSAGLKLMHLMSESLRQSQSMDGSGIWYKGNFIREKLKDEKVLYVYLGLLWEQSDNITFSNGKTARNLIESFTNQLVRVEEFKEFIRKFGDLSNEITMSIDQLSEKKAVNKDAYRDYQAVFKSVFDVIEQGLVFKNSFMSGLGGVKIKTSKDSILLESLRHLNNLHYNVRQNNYPQAVYHAVQIVDNITEKHLPWRDEMLKYGMFMARVSQADSATQIADAIEAIALPPQSSAGKKYGLRLGLNAYTAIMGGGERLDSDNPAQKDTRKAVFGIAAPVGLEFSVGLKKGGSLSAFFPVIDIGAVTAMRFNDFSKPLPELTFSNIVAPGAYCIYGFYGVPISIGGGWQQGPQLRKIKPNGVGEFVGRGGSRWSIFIGVDIPLLQFYRK